MTAKGNSPAHRSNGEITPPTPFEIMIRAMAMDAEAEDDTFGGDDLNAILTAETEAELWDADERPPLNFQHLVECELEILGFDVKFSRGASSSVKTPFVWMDDNGDKKKMYLLVKCVRISEAGEKSLIKLPSVGEVFTANTSARFVVAKLWRGMTMGLFDEARGITWPCMVREIQLGDDQAVLKLRPMPKRVTRSTVE